MQKKLLAVAVAGALGAPALAMAQTSTVQIFGTFYLEYGYSNQGRPPGAVPPLGDRQSVDYLGNPGSELGIKGEEKLGGGLSAWFQCASTMNYLDSGDGVGADTDSLLCSRNSAIGLKGGFGNVFVGRWDAPYKRAAAPWRVGVNETGFWGVAFMTHGGSTSTAAGQSRSTFLRREQNSINYDTPNIGGFQGMAMFTSSQGPNFANGTGTAATGGVTSSKPRTLSLGAQYSAGPIYVGVGYQEQREVGNIGGENDDKGWHAGAAYTWGPVRVGGGYAVQKHEISGSAAPAGSPGVPFAAGSSDAKYRSWHLGVDWNIVGPHGLRAGYTKALDAKGNATSPAAAGATNNILAGAAGGIGGAGGGGYRPAPCTGPTLATRVCGDTGAQMWQVRYVYTLSKRTEFNIGYARTNNDDNAAYVPNHLSTPLRGETTSTWATSLRHTF
jgi:predicted porin